MRDGEDGLISPSWIGGVCGGTVGAMDLVWLPRAQKDGERLEPIVRARVVAALERLAETGHGDVVKLRGIDPPEYRLRVGDYRIRFRLRGGILEVLRVAHRREVYRM